MGHFSLRTEEKKSHFSIIFYFSPLSLFRRGFIFPHFQRGFPILTIHFAGHPDERFLLHGGLDHLVEEGHLRNDGRNDPQINQRIANVAVQKKGKKWPF